MKTYEELLDERDAAMREASELAMCIWRSEFRNESPEFELCDSPAGVITQIDNMFAGIRQKRDALAAQVDALSSKNFELTCYRVDVLRCLKTIAFEHNHSDVPLYQPMARQLMDSISANAELKEAQAEAGRAGFIAGYHNMHIEFVGSLASSEGAEFAASQYVAKIRNAGTWLKDSNVNGGKRQGEV